MTKVTLKQLLSRLRREQRARPPSERLTVPSHEDIAKAAGYSRTAVSEFANNQHTGINREILDAAMGLLKQCGHDITYDDLLSRD